MMPALDDFIEEARPGPWRQEPVITDEGLQRRQYFVWLTNDAGDSLCVDEETVAALVNASITEHP